MATTCAHVNAAAVWTDKPWHHTRDTYLKVWSSLEGGSVPVMSEDRLWVLQRERISLFCVFILLKLKLMRAWLCGAQSAT